MRVMETSVKKNFTCEILKNKWGMIIVYWPTTRLGCQNRKCPCVNNRCIWSRNIRIITLTMDGLNECNCDAHKKKGASNYYITQCTRNSISWRQDAVEKTSTQRGWAPGPRLSSPGERERNTDGHKSGDQYVAVLFSLQLPLTHNPFNKVRGIFF